MGKLVRAEWYRLIHERAFWILLGLVILAYLLVLAGGHQLEASGREVLGLIVGGRAAAAIIIASVFGGLFMGRDFEARTFSLPIQAGFSRVKVLLAKALVCLISFSVLILIFPLLAVMGCTLINGWGGPFTFGEVVSLITLFAALALLVASIAALSVLTACCFRSAGSTVAVPVALMLLQLPLLNSPSSLQSAYFLPFCATWYVANGTIVAFYGIILGLAWCVILLTLSALIVHRIELK